FVEDDQSFEHHVDCMSRNATYGGNMELAAFAKMQQVNIKVYQPGLIYIIHGKEEQEDDTQVLHIAYHSWEHYSSVRNIDGPYTGPPDIQIKIAEDNPQEEIELTSQEKIVLNACPDTNLQTIRQFLKKHKGIPDDAINAIYESQLEEAVETHDEASDKPSDTDDTTHETRQEDLNMHEQDLLDQFPNLPPETIQTVWKKHGNSMDAIKELQGIVLPKPKKQKILSSRERKELAKKKRKEEAMLKKRAKAQRQQSYKEQDRPDSANDDITKIIKTMKEIDI
ncbi:uncharacterized protein EV154DRAFT_425276, partial [Mucor mucedo]|uniref:uncharacterized protein n=1 Tax=Mucor mucedo TaxID=29922 RepID=UPI00221FD003